QAFLLAHLLFNYLALMISHLNLRSTLSGCTASAASSLSSKESRFVFFYFALYSFQGARPFCSERDISYQK
ncbi:MAG: hypothetical protein IKU32_08950, partial [Clostridia bacterium]|nr:hypothetical protein [Clostridia bacterium]